jgi:hypothetical protein
MTTTTTTIAKARDEFLAALNDTQVSTELLQQLTHAGAQTPGLLEPHVVDGITHAIDADPLSWSQDYFSRQKSFAARNFSTERLEHLIQVRELFRQRNEKGFTPTVAASRRVNEQMESRSSSYQPSSNLKRFVGEGDLLTIRTALRLELNDLRLDGAELRAALEWIKDTIPKIFETFSVGAFAREFGTDCSQWTPDYYGLQVTYLKTNFSEKRFLHLIEVREQLRNSAAEGFAPAKAADLETTSGSRSALQSAQAPRSRSRQSIPVGTPEHNPAFKAALLIGGAIAAVVVFLVALVR